MIDLEERLQVSMQLLSEQLRRNITDLDADTKRLIRLELLRIRSGDLIFYNGNGVWRGGSAISPCVAREVIEHLCYSYNHLSSAIHAEDTI